LKGNSNDLIEELLCDFDEEFDRLDKKKWKESFKKIRESRNLMIYVASGN
jgi:hypothetical protein